MSLRALISGIPLFPDSSTRSQQLDVLRFAAVTLVLLNHMYSCPAEISPTAHVITKTLIKGGWIGVDLFFVLSGFLIASLLFREYQTHGRISLTRFFIRRGLKIYPPFWAFLLFAIFVETRYGGRVSLDWLRSELLFIQNYGTAGRWSYTWSLAVEEHFYLVLPVMLVLMLRRVPAGPNPFRCLPAVFGIVATGCLLARLYLAMSFPFDLKTHYIPTHLRIDSLLFGVLISYWLHFQPARFNAIAQRYRTILIPSGLLLLLPAFVLERSHPYMYTFGYAQLYIGSGLLLVGFLQKELKPSALVSVFAFVGSRSYSIYLWHGPTVWFADERFNPTANFFNWLSWNMNYFGGAIFMGIAMAALVELPILTLRNRLFPSRSGHLATPRAATIPASFEQSHTVALVSGRDGVLLKQRV